MAGPPSKGGSTLKYGLPQLDDGTGAGAKGININWFTTNLTYPGIPTDMVFPLRIFFSIDTNAKVEITRDGTNYFRLNSDQIITAKSAFEFGMIIDNTSTFNIRSPTALTVEFAVVIGEI